MSSLPPAGPFPPSLSVRRMHTLVAKGCDFFMALINRLDNTASVTYNGTTVSSNPVSTLLLLPPTVVKSVDRPTASIGDTLTYTVTVTNVSLSPISSLPFSDTIPEGAVYLTDSFTLNGSPVTPTISGSTLSYTIPSIPAAGIAILTFQVLVEGSAG